MRSAHLVRTIRAEAGLSLRDLAQAAGVSTSTVHRIERGTLRPTMETLERIAEAAGVRLVIQPVRDYAVSVIGLAASIREDIAHEDWASPVRKAAELSHRFGRADDLTRQRMIAAEPRPLGDARGDAFVAALAEWLAVRAGSTPPEWIRQPARYLDRGWWVMPMSSMHAWEFAGSPASFQTRGIYLHRDSLVNL